MSLDFSIDFYKTNSLSKNKRRLRTLHNMPSVDCHKGLKMSVLMKTRKYFLRD